MGFNRFGIVSYTKEAKVVNFLKYLEEGRIMGTKCKKCGKLYFPPRFHCINCLEGGAEWVELSGRCKLITYSIVQFAPTGFEGVAPYVLALVEFEEGVRAVAHISKRVKLDEIKVGMDLKLVPTKFNDKVSYTLEPID